MYDLHYHISLFCIYIYVFIQIGFKLVSRKVGFVKMAVNKLFIY